jgi:hypothetical protein
MSEGDMVDGEHSDAMAALTQVMAEQHQQPVVDVDSDHGEHHREVFTIGDEDLLCDSPPQEEKREDHEQGIEQTDSAQYRTGLSRYERETLFIAAIEYLERLRRAKTDLLNAQAHLRRLSKEPRAAAVAGAAENGEATDTAAPSPKVARIESPVAALAVATPPAPSVAAPVAKKAGEDTTRRSRMFGQLRKTLVAAATTVDATAERQREILRRKEDEERHAADARFEHALAKARRAVDAAKAHCDTVQERYEHATVTEAQYHTVEAKHALSHFLVTDGIDPPMYFSPVDLPGPLGEVVAAQVSAVADSAEYREFRAAVATLMRYAREDIPQLMPGARVGGFTGPRGGRGRGRGRGGGGFAHRHPADVQGSDVFPTVVLPVPSGVGEARAVVGR